MFNFRTINVRGLLQNPREVFDLVQQTKQPTVVTSNTEPQVAIVSLDDLKALEHLKRAQATKALLDLVGIIPKGSGLPKDLAENHDKYLWE